MFAEQYAKGRMTSQEIGIKDGKMKEPYSSMLTRPSGKQLQELRKRLTIGRMPARSCGKNWIRRLFTLVPHILSQFVTR